MTWKHVKWCANCGHMDELHSSGRCSGLSRYGLGDEYDGGDFAPCVCSEFDAIPMAPSGRTDAEADRD